MKKIQIYYFSNNNEKLLSSINYYFNIKNILGKCLKKKRKYFFNKTNL